MLGRILNQLSRCVVCDDLAPNATLCRPCQQRLPTLRWPCPRCAMPRRTRHSLCGACLLHTPAWDNAACAFAYRFPVDYLLKRAKFRGLTPEIDALAEATARQLSTLPIAGADFILPVPLHWRRRWRRGFNQAEELARPLARIYGINLQLKLLVRTRPTREQSRLDTDNREHNLAGAFSCRDSLEGARVILFDDVMTTGATLNAATDAAVMAGAAHVRVLTCARAVWSSGR